MFAEAVLGRFNAAERIDLTRFWNWQDSPIPITAPEIASIQTGSRAQSEPGGPGELGTPVVNIQNAPGLPDPQGLTAVLQALANGAMFRDMSGLEGTQQLARAFLEETMRGATASAAQAGQNMRTATDFASRMAALQGSSQQSRWGGSNTPNSLTGEGGRLNYGRELDQRQDGAVLGAGGQTSSAERDQYNAGIGGAGSAVADESSLDEGPSFELANANVSESRRWRDLICFRPPDDVLQSLRRRSMQWLRLDNALGRLINLDNYEVRIARMPVVNGTRLDARGLAREFRRGLTGQNPIFVDPEASTFLPYDPDDGTRLLSDNPVGAVLYIDIPWDDGAVVVSRADAQRWVFTTVETERSGVHPVSGNREFGVTGIDNGQHVLFARGADRASGLITSEALLGQGSTFAGGERLWLSMQQRVAAWINANQGEASIITPYSERFSWLTVRSLVRCPQQT